MWPFIEVSILDNSNIIMVTKQGFVKKRVNTINYSKCLINYLIYSCPNNRAEISVIRRMRCADSPWNVFAWQANHYVVFTSVVAIALTGTFLRTKGLYMLIQYSYLLEDSVCFYVAYTVKELSKTRVSIQRMQVITETKGSYMSSHYISILWNEFTKMIWHELQWYDMSFSECHIQYS